ncbi:acyl carrier protein [Acinetobacter sp. HY1485]|uniref:acyl carrier protein n=1 Tax=Acinetobacter sp. HY1485 TaxID=2970918 RepID=UPI0022B9CC37|nr:phosphopantetheine-binding protein [Acinetobacter sp. HY1485]
MLSEQDAMQALKNAVESVLHEKFPNFNMETKLFDDLRMDSVSMLETLIELEDSLNIDVNPEDLDIEDFLVVKSYVKFLMDTVNT